MSLGNALIIDDEPDVATYLAAVLADHGWRVRVAHRAEEGLEKAREDLPDLVLLDLRLPDVSGLDVLQQLKAAGLVEARRDGKPVRSRLSDDRALDAVRDLRVLAEAHLDQVGDLVSSYLRRRDALEAVPANELLERARKRPKKLAEQQLSIPDSSGSERGLLVPIIRNADRKNITAISVELDDLARRQRSRNSPPRVAAASPSTAICSPLAPPKPQRMTLTKARFMALHMM